MNDSLVDPQPPPFIDMIVDHINEETRTNLQYSFSVRGYSYYYSDVQCIPFGLVISSHEIYCVATSPSQMGTFVRVDLYDPESIDIVCKAINSYVKCNKL